MRDMQEAAGWTRPRSATSSTGAPTSLSLNPCSKASPPRNSRSLFARIASEARAVQAAPPGASRPRQRYGRQFFRTHTGGSRFRPGDDNRQIALIRKRLGVSGQGAKETAYDTALLEAVNLPERAWARVTGIIDQRFRASLNETAGGGGGGSIDEKRQRILINMERWRWMPESLGEFYVWDSVPEQYTRVFDHGKMVLQERIVVESPRRRRQPSPRICSSSFSTRNGACRTASKSTKLLQDSETQAAEAAVSSSSAAAGAAKSCSGLGGSA